MAHAATTGHDGAMDHVVIVGAGLAAVHAVETLRTEGYAGSLTIVGAEPQLPYERPQLSKEFLKGADFGLAHEAEWYAERDVRVLTSTRATDLDLDDGTITLDNGERLSFDAVLLATGAVPRTLDLPGIRSARMLRTIDDAEDLRASLLPGVRVALVGGGWIGLEVAAAAREAGAEVVVLEMAEVPLGNVLGAEVAGRLADLHARHGVEIRAGVTVEEIEPGGVRVGGELVEADLVVVAVGAVPETSLAEGAGLEVSNGIVVDEHLRTADPRVYAAGDVAQARHTTLGPLRVEHWDNAIRQGRLAALAMLGKDAAYDWQPYFFTDQFEFSMEYVGRSAPDDEVVIRGDVDAPAYIVYWLREGPDGAKSVTAGMNVGIWDVNDKLRAMVGQRVDPETLTDLQ